METYGSGATTGGTAATIRGRLQAIQQVHIRDLAVFYGAAAGAVIITSVGRRIATASSLNTVAST